MGASALPAEKVHCSQSEKGRERLRSKWSTGRASKGYSKFASPDVNFPAACESGGGGRVPVFGFYLFRMDLSEVVLLVVVGYRCRYAY